MITYGRRHFLKVTAAGALSPLVGGCIPRNNPYYRAGYALGKADKVRITTMLRVFMEEFPEYLSALEDPDDAARILVTLDLERAEKSIDPTTREVLTDTVLGSQSVARTLYDQSPNNYYKLTGIADGAFGPHMRDFLFLLQCLEITMPRLHFMDPGLCSALVLRPSATTFGEPVLAKNFDLLNVTGYGCVMRESRPEAGFPSLDNTLCILPGAISTLNPYFCVTHNTLPGAMINDRYLPGTCTEQDMAETCRSLDEAIAFLDAAQNGGYFLFSMADAEGNIALVEGTPYGKEVMIPDKDYLVVTNHSQIPHPNAPDGAIRTDLGPDTFIRHARITQLVETMLDEKGKLDIDDIKAIMSDHENGGDLDSICRHTRLAGTVSSVIMLPQSHRVYAAAGHPCETPFIEYNLT